MKVLAQVRAVLWAMTHRSQLSHEMDEELRSHIQLRTDDLVRSGMEQSEAERQARIELGGYEGYKEACHNASGSSFGQTLLRDIRFSLKIFRKFPILTMVAIGTLILGIGANTAIFSLVDALWLRPLQIADPLHLIAINSVKNHTIANSEQTIGISYAEYGDLRRGVPAFSDIMASNRRAVVLQTADGVQLLLADVVSDNYFPVIGVRPELGHLPDENELRGFREPVIILSYGTWKRVFGGNPDMVGQTVTIRGRQAVVLAVMPVGFRGTERLIDPQVYVPLSSWYIWEPGERSIAASSRANREFEIYARLRQGTTLDQARAQLQSLSSALAASYPQANSDRSFTADWQTKSQGGGVKVLSLLLLAIAGAALLIACANIANLLLALNDSRRREFAMRVALGASRRRLVRQLLTEYLMLAIAGIGGALILARQLVHLAPALIPDVGFPIGFDARIDHRVLAFAVGTGLLSVLICGLIPAFATTRTSPLDAMRNQLPQSGVLRMPARKIFVVAQLAVSMALLMATGLLIRSLMQIENVNLGFNSRQNAVLMRIAVSGQGPQRQAELDTLTTRITALPGVKDASLARVVPFPESGGGSTKVVLAPGELPSETAGTPVWFNSVDNQYFGLMGIPLARGRTFEVRDTAAGPRVVILNEVLAKKLFGNADVVGRHVRLGRQDPVDVEIVGVAYDGKYSELSETPQPYLYLPLSQESRSEVTLIVTTIGDPGALLPVIRKTLQQTSPTTLILNAQTLTDHMRFATYSNRLAVWLTASLGALALLLTTLGLYGVTAYAVSRRTHEIGIRVALGALRGRVFRSVLKDGLKLTLTGMILGTGIALLLARGMGSLLFGVKPLDPVTIAGVTAVVITTSLLALIVPARWALRVDPVVALREE